MSNSDSKGDEVVKFPLMSAALGYTRIHEDELGAGFHWASRPAANIHRMSPINSKGKESGTARILGSGTSGMCYVATLPRTDQQLTAFGQT